MPASSAKDDAPMMLMAELLYEAKPDLSKEQFQHRLSTRLPQSKVESTPSSLMVVHHGHPAQFKEGSIATQTVIMVSDRPSSASGVESALQQTRDWPEARAVTERSQHQALVTEFMARSLDLHTRLHLFQSVLIGLVETKPPLAIHLQHAERVVDPSQLIQAAKSSNPADLAFASLNVRMFRIENGQSGDILMDTRGLAALGLPDIQIHFHGLNPGQVASFLYNCAYYLFQNGDCIADGNTIQGLHPNQKWRCQHEDSLVPPHRQVLDVNPAPPFAAGHRP